MMTRQSRKLKVTEPAMNHGSLLREYPPDSSRAKARLIVLALLADGKLDNEELEALARRGTFNDLGISPGDFVQVLYDFCSDMARAPSDTGNYVVSPDTIESLLDDVRSSDGRKTLLRLIFDVIRSDGRLSAGEARLFWNAIDAWNLRLDDGRSAMRRANLRRLHKPSSIPLSAW